MNTVQIIAIAERHARAMTGGMQSSALLCISDAKICQSQGDAESVKRRALKSLAYSVGISHPDYIAASKSDVLAGIEAGT